MKAKMKRARTASTAAGLRAIILAGGKGVRLHPFTVNFPGPTQRLGEHRRDDGACGLPRTERVEWPQGDHGQIEATEVGFGQFVGRNLARGIG